MINNKVRRNLWLALAIMSAAAVIDRAIRVAEGSIEWWNLIAAIAITALCTRFYLCYRNQVKKGNLNGRVKVIK